MTFNRSTNKVTVMECCCRGILICCCVRRKRISRFKMFPLFLGFMCGYSVFYLVTVFILMQRADYCTVLHNPFPKQVFGVERPDDPFLLVAVMTTRHNLETRAEALYRIWGTKIPGSILFFIGDGAEPYTGDLPVVILEGVPDNAFPPQRKSFSMVKYLADFFVNEYEFFMRADDDLYVKPDRLEIFLRTINSSQALYLGSPGYGKGDELFKLGLKKNEAFCMGGPGIFFTSDTLQRIRDYLPYCMGHTSTYHEDTELGRCVQHYANIQCSHAYEWSRKFIHNAQDLQGSYTHKLGEREEIATSLHPVKQSPHMYRLYSHFAGINIQKLRLKLDNLARDIDEFDQLIKEKIDPRSTVTPTEQLRRRLGELNGWTMSEKDLDYDSEDIEDSHREEWELIMNKRVIYSMNDVANINDANTTRYFKIVPNMEAQLSVKHQTTLQKRVPKFSPISYQRLSHGKCMENIIIKEIPKASSSYRTVHNFHGLEWTDSTHNLTSTVWILVTLYKQSANLPNFLTMASQTSEKFKGTMNLQIILFYDNDGDHVIARKHLDEERNYSKMLNINVVFVYNEPFSRIRGLIAGMDEITDESLLLLMNVDVKFDEEFLKRAILNTEYAKQVFFPIPFIQYDPKIVCGHNKQCDLSVNNLDNKYGMWHHVNYMILSIYKGDLIKVGGLDTDISASASENEALYKKCINSNLRVLRSIDPSLIRAHHQLKCARTSSSYDECVSHEGELSGSDVSLVNIINHSNIAIDLEY